MFVTGFGTASQIEVIQLMNLIEHQVRQSNSKTYASEQELARLPPHVQVTEHVLQIQVVSSQSVLPA
jgi:hypothetical protein